MLRLSAIALAAAVLAACAGAPPRPAAAPPLLRLAPAALGHDFAEQQRLEFRQGDQRQTVDALVEVDAGEVRVLLHANGQPALRLSWDGQALAQVRAEGLPPALSSEHVLSDLQLVYWPAPAINAALPPGWRVEEHGRERVLLEGEAVVARVAVLDASHRRLDQLALGYSLLIESATVAP